MAKNIVGEAYIDMKVDGQKFSGEINKLGNDAKLSLEQRIGSFDLAKLKIKLRELNELLKEAIYKGNEKNEIAIRANIEDVQKKMSLVRKEISDTQKTAETGANTFTKFANALVGAYAIDKIKSFGGAMIDIADKYEQADISFTTMLGSAEASKKLLSDLSTFAKNTPFEVIGIRENAKQLLAMGIASKDIIPTLKSLGDVSAGLGVPLERLTLAYGQVIAKGKLQGGELKQFTEAGVPLIKVMSEQLKVSEAGFYKLVEAGKISSSDVVQAFQTMSSEGGTFSNLMDKQSQALTGMKSNLADTWTGIGELFGLMLLPMMKDFVGVLSSISENMYDFFKEFPVFSKALLGLTTALAGIIIALTGYGLILPAITAATSALGVSLLGILWPIGAVIAAGAILYKAYKSNFMGFASFVDGFIYDTKVFLEIIKSIVLAISNSFKGLRINISGTIELIKKAFGSISSIIPPINSVFSQVAKIVSGSVGSMITSVNGLLGLLKTIPGVGTLIKGIQGNISGVIINAKKNVDNAANVAAFKKAQNEKYRNINTPFKLDFDLNNLFPPKAPSGGGGSSKSSKDQAKEELEIKKKLIEDKLKLDIDAVKKSTITEYEKAKRIISINEESQRAIQDLEGKTTDLSVKDAKEIVKAHEDKTAKLKKYGEEIIKIGVKFEDMKDDVLKNIRDINNELSSLDENLNNDLAKRFVDVQKEMGNVTSYDEYTKLDKERVFLLENTTEEMRKQAIEYDNLTQAEKTLLKYQQDKATLEEKKGIATAFNNQDSLLQKSLTIDPETNKVFYENEKGELIAITDLKNQEYARDLINKQLSMQQELTIKQQEIAGFIQSEEQLYSKKKELLLSFTSDVEKTTEIQKNNLKGLIDMFKQAVQGYKQYQAAMSSGSSSSVKTSGGRAFGGSIMPNMLYNFQENGLPEYIRSPSYSRVQPAPASHYKTQNITINNQNQLRSFGSGDEFGNWLNQNIGNHL